MLRILSRKRMLLTIVLLLSVVLLAGCSMDPLENPIDPANGFWDKFFVNPLNVSLDWFANHLWMSYGLAILIVTLIIRFAILPLTIKQVRSSKKMQEIQPELQKIKEKYKDDTQKQQEETMKLFQKHGVNPLAGCFPLLIQMPVLIALYHAIMRNSHIGESAFLWLQLGEKDPYYILPLIAAATTFIQQKMMSATMPAQMRSLMFVFPVLIFVMSMYFPAALPLYWVFSNLFTIVQNYFIYGTSRMKVEPEAGTQANAKQKAKPKKR